MGVNIMALDDNLISYYKLDEASNPIVDELGANDAVNSGTNFSVGGKINDAHDFEKDFNEHIKLDDGSGTIGITTGDLSVSMWIKREQLSYNQCGLIGSAGNNGFSIALNSSNLVGFAKVGVAQTFGTTTISDTNFHFLLVTLNDSADEVKFYLDGVLDSTITWTETFSTGVAYDLGRVQAVDNFDGVMDEVGIWHRTLNASEVSELYNSGDGLAYPFPSAPTFTLTTAVSPLGKGSVSGAGDFDEDEVVPVEATPIAGWVFDEWTGDLTGSVNPTTVLMDDNKSITANFEEESIELSFTSGQVGVSLPIDLNHGVVTEAKLTAVITSGSFDFEMSADNGANWETVTNGVAHVFSNTGSALRWRITENAASTGVITQINVDDYH